MIIKLELNDKENWTKLYENWTKLYNEYADFYKVPMNTEILDEVKK